MNVDDADLGDAAIDLTAELVAIDSVNPGLVAGAAGEAEVVRHLATRLGAAGFDIDIVDAPGVAGRPSLLATRRGNGGGRSLVLNGHVDTVGIGAMTDPFSARIDGDRLTGTLAGRGACDMKAGVAAMVVAAEHVAAMDPAGDIVLALVADEENESIGTTGVIDVLRRRGALPAACIVGEPTWNDVVVAHRGFSVAEVTLRGRSCHSSQPENGANAVAHLGRLLVAVEAFDAELAGREPHPTAGVGSLTATVARGGEALFSLGAAATVLVERRTVPGERDDQAVRELEAIASRLGADDPAFDASIELVIARPAWELDHANRVATDLLESMTAHLTAGASTPPVIRSAPYWMESALWELAGVPALVCGPAGGGMHRDDEWVELVQVRAYTNALADVMADFCAAAR